MAVFTSPYEASSAAWTSAEAAPVTSCTSENARATSFAFVARTSTMRLPYVSLQRTIASVVSMFSTSFCAVPAFRRVEPAMNSGPTTTSMAMSASRPAAESGLHAMETDRAERRRASRMAAIT